MAGLHFVVVQQVGALVVTNSCAVRAEGQLEVGELSRGDDGQHPCREAQRSAVCPYLRFCFNFKECFLS